MNRRGFAGLLGGIVVGTKALASTTVGLAESVPRGVNIPKLDDFKRAWAEKPTLDNLNALFAEPMETGVGCWSRYYLDGRAVLGWTGWKMDINSTILASQWIACVQASAPYVFAPEPKKRYFVSSTPGVADEYQRGYVFNIAIQQGQTFLDYFDCREKPAVLWNKAACAKIEALYKLDQFIKERL